MTVLPHEPEPITLEVHDSTLGQSAETRPDEENADG